MVIRNAQPAESEILRKIAAAAKGHWQYDFMDVQKWANTLAFSDCVLGSKEIYVADLEGEISGWATLLIDEKTALLDDLWIDPKWMGKGVGGALFKHSQLRAKGLGLSTMEWEAEPNAVGFYQKMGGTYRRDSKPTIWGRILPIMGIDL